MILSEGKIIMKNEKNSIHNDEPSLFTGLCDEERTGMRDAINNEVGFVTVKDFLAGFADSDECRILLRRLLEKYPFEDADGKIIEDVETQSIDPSIIKAFDGFMQHILSIPVHESDYVLFVAPGIPTEAEDFRNLRKYLDTNICNEHLSKDYQLKELPVVSWMCSSQQIIDNASRDMTLWKQDSRIEHYGYDMLPWDETLSARIWIYGLSYRRYDIACEIIHNMTFFGWLPNERVQNIDGIKKELEVAIDNLETGAGDAVPADEVFRKLRDEIFAESSEEERQKMIEEEERERKHEGRNQKFLLYATEMSHKIRINAIFDYCLHLMSLVQD